MSADELLKELYARGVSLRVNGDKLKVTGQVETITEQDKAILASMKPAIIELLSRPAAGTMGDRATPKKRPAAIAALTRPSAGTMANPITVHANRAPSICYMDDCQGQLTGRRHLWQCETCGCWFAWAGPVSEDDAILAEIDAALRALEDEIEGEGGKSKWVN